MRPGRAQPRHPRHARSRLLQVFGIERGRQSRRADEIAKRTVSWRLSGSDCARAEAGAAAAGVAPDDAAIALRIRFRWPSATPNLSRSASVTSGKTSRSMAFSAKTVAYARARSHQASFLPGH